MKPVLFNMLAGLSLLLCGAVTLQSLGGMNHSYGRITLDFNHQNCRIYSVSFIGDSMGWCSTRETWPADYSPPLSYDAGFFSGNIMAFEPPLGSGHRWNYLGVHFYSGSFGDDYVFTERQFLLRDWLWIILLGILPSVAFLRSRKKKRAMRRMASGLCPMCGYDIRATPDRCPECGKVPVKTTVTS